MFDNLSGVLAKFEQDYNEERAFVNDKSSRTQVKYQAQKTREVMTWQRSKCLVELETD